MQAASSLLLAALAFTGCTSPQGDALLRQRTEPEYVDASALSGTLTQKGNCFVVGNLSIIWPYDARLTQENGIVAISSAKSNSRVKLGAPILLMGGEITTEAVRRRPAEWKDLDASGCKPPYFLSGKFSGRAS